MGSKIIFQQYIILTNKLQYFKNYNNLVMKTAEIMAYLEKKYGHEKEYLQAVAL